MFGVPEALLSDRGTNLLLHLMLDICSLLGIEKLNTTSYHPECDGTVERFNRTHKSMLRKRAPQFNKQWDNHLPSLLWAYRNAPHDTTGEKPSFLLFGWDCRSPQEAALLPVVNNTQLTNIEDYREELILTLSSARKTAVESIRKAQERYKTSYDRNSDNHSYRVGVWVVGVWVVGVWVVGDWVVGVWVVGDWVVGDWVVGVWVVGDWVVGDWVVGDWVVGDWVVGDWVVGDWVVGDWVVGDWVVGDWVVGDWVVGDWVVGDWVVGDWVVGDWVVGDWVVGDWVLIRFPSEETGMFCKLSRPWHGRYRVTSCNETNITAAKIYFPCEDPIQVHQLRVKPCPPGFPAGFFWYGAKCRGPGSPPRWVQDLLAERENPNSTSEHAHIPAAPLAPDNEGDKSTIGQDDQVTGGDPDNSGENVLPSPLGELSESDDTQHTLQSPLHPPASSQSKRGEGTDTRMRYPERRSRRPPDWLM